MLVYWLVVAHDKKRIQVSVPLSQWKSLEEERLRTVPIPKQRVQVREFFKKRDEKNPDHNYYADQGIEGVMELFNWVAKQKKEIDKREKQRARITSARNYKIVLLVEFNFGFTGKDVSILNCLNLEPIELVFLLGTGNKGGAAKEEYQNVTEQLQKDHKQGTKAEFVRKLEYKTIDFLIKQDKSAQGKDIFSSSRVMLLNKFIKEIKCDDPIAMFRAHCTDPTPAVSPVSSPAQSPAVAGRRLEHPRVSALRRALYVSSSATKAASSDSSPDSSSPVVKKSIKPSRSMHEFLSSTAVAADAASSAASAAAVITATAPAMSARPS